MVCIYCDYELFFKEDAEIHCCDCQEGYKVMNNLIQEGYRRLTLKEIGDFYRAFRGISLEYHEDWQKIDPGFFCTQMDPERRDSYTCSECDWCIFKRPDRIPDRCYEIGTRLRDVFKWMKGANYD